MDSGRLEAAPSGAVHLDTVRALHQTVVSLRTALEVSKNELKQLKEKYEQHSHCLEYADVIEKLTLENHILRRRIIESDYQEKDPDAQNIKLEVTYNPHTHNIEEFTSSEVVIATATDRNSTIDELEPIPQESDENSNFCSAEKLNEIPEDVEEFSEAPESPAFNESAESIPPDDANNNTEIGEISQVSSLPKETEEPEELHQPSFKTKLELLSKFDVRIKVRTLKEGTIVSSTTSESDSSEDRRAFEKDSTVFTGQRFQEKEGQVDNKSVNIKSITTDNVRMAVPNEADVKSKSDKFDVQVRITSEENLVVKENIERSRRKDTLNLDVDDLSLRSLSEGDNSVFSEGGTTPIDPNAAAASEEKQEDNASGNESEEVDDIELIFTTDESKDMSNLQEDLVSIREGDQWAPQSASTAHSTPVLIKFHTLDPDFQPGQEIKTSPTENQENTERPIEVSKQKRVSLPNDKEIRHVAFNGKGNLDLPGRSILKSCDNRSDNMLYRKSPNTSSRRLDSIDSLTCEYNRGLSFDNTKSSSFELGSSMDILHREESVDSFHRNINLGHRYSVFAETDISKCGTSEDDLAANLNVRRNTCPNPFQYRPSNFRGVSRPPGPFKAGTARLRPVLRDGAHPRRESGAQTDVCALPPRWSSDGYLAHKLPVPPTSVPTVPSRAVTTTRRLTVPDARPPPPVRRTDETRRVLLSDIGFTSMVPELSRSADPVWALGKRQSHPDDSTTTSTSKFLSRGSSYRSPCLSIDRSNDWTPQNMYLPSSRDSSRPWRSSLPDVRRDDTDELLEEAEMFVRRSIDNLQAPSIDLEKSIGVTGQPYIPSEPRQLRLGHTVKVITPHGRIAVGRVRYVGLAGASTATSSVVVGAELVHSAAPGLPRNDGLYRGRRYFLAHPLHTALFVPFSKVVMAWAN
ncbi:uncharacterized protein LOC111354145 [Spodoptera litura]|uniref:Uncharacterized protein LOC111354145 n=1 Tax=Spodoptera litura TaxID=69820 RepID=A0A9J7E6P6_SPOLT|nr:uncharacterized protein LOC111354145 [Spodoptera litura]